MEPLTPQTIEAVLETPYQHPVANLIREYASSLQQHYGLLVTVCIENKSPNVEKLPDNFRDALNSIESFSLTPESMLGIMGTLECMDLGYIVKDKQVGKTDLPGARFHYALACAISAAYMLADPVLRRHRGCYLTEEGELSKELLETLSHYASAKQDAKKRCEYLKEGLNSIRKLIDTKALNKEMDLIARSVGDDFANGMVPILTAMEMALLE